MENQLPTSKRRESAGAKEGTIITTTISHSTTAKWITHGAEMPWTGSVKTNSSSWCATPITSQTSDRGNQGTFRWESPGTTLSTASSSSRLTTRVQCSQIVKARILRVASHSTKSTLIRRPLAALEESTSCRSFITFRIHQLSYSERVSNKMSSMEVTAANQ